MNNQNLIELLAKIKAKDKKMNKTFFAKHTDYSTTQLSKFVNNAQRVPEPLNLYISLLLRLEAMGFDLTKFINKNDTV